MKTFEYKGFDVRGHARRGFVEASSIKEARERLAAEDVLAERVRVTGRRIRLATSDRAVIYRELSALLTAGLPLARALDVLLTTPDVKDARLCLAGLRDLVREGSSLADGMSAVSSSVTDFEHAMIEAAERSATVDPVLEQLADFLEQRERVRQRIQMALVYPSIVVAVGICVAMLMLGLLVPRARALLASGTQSLPALTRVMMSVGDYLTLGVVPVLVFAVVAGIVIRKHWSTDADFRGRWDRRSFALPVMGRGYALLVNERFCRTLALLLRGGVSLVDGVLLAGKSTGSAWISEQCVIAAEAVRHGDSLSEAVRRIPPLASFLPGWLQIGEAGGNLPRLLASAADRCAARWERFVTLCLGLLEPLLILIIGAFVLLVTLAVLLPVLQLSKGL